MPKHALPTATFLGEDDDVSGLMAKASEAKAAGQWGSAAIYYDEAIDLLDERISNVVTWSKREDAKHIALTCCLQRLYCIIEARRNPDITHHDMSDTVKRELRETERKIKGYGICNEKYSWNIMESYYDRLEKESRQQGRDYEASEFSLAMLRARCQRLKASGDRGTFIRLTIFDWLFGFGHRLNRTVLWVLGIIVTFSILYFLGYDGLVVNAGTQGSCLSATISRCMQSLRISIFLLFIPDRLEGILQPQNAWMEAILSLEALLGYVVNVGLIALAVNALSSRRKW